MCLLIPFINYFFQNNINFLMICLEVKHTSFHSEPYLYIVYTFTVLWMSYLSGYTTKVNAPSLKEEKFLQSSYHYFKNFRIPCDFKGNLVQF